TLSIAADRSTNRSEGIQRAVCCGSIYLCSEVACLRLRAPGLDASDVAEAEKPMHLVARLDDIGRDLSETLKVGLREFDIGETNILSFWRGVEDFQGCDSAIPLDRDVVIRDAL